MIAVRGCEQVIATFAISSIPRRFIDEEFDAMSGVGTYSACVRLGYRW